MELIGEISGEVLTERGYSFFEAKRIYWIGRPSKAGVVEVSSYSGHDGPDEDGYGREDYYDWWLLDEELNRIPDIPAFYDYSDRELRDSKWDAYKEKAEEIMRKKQSVSGR